MDFFKLKQNGTSVKTEPSAGLTTFLTMMYIVPVNAIIMSKTGMPMDALITATALITVIATVLNGLWANTPVAKALEWGPKRVFYLWAGAWYADTVADGSRRGFISGIIFVVLSFTNFRIWVLKSIPSDVRRSISAGIGAFIAFVGLQQMGVVVNNDAVLVGLEIPKRSRRDFGLCRPIFRYTFWAWKVKGAFIIAVFTTSVIAWVFGIMRYPKKVISLPASISPIF